MLRMSDETGDHETHNRLRDMLRAARVLNARQELPPCTNNVSRTVFAKHAFYRARTAIRDIPAGVWGHPFAS